MNLNTLLIVLGFVISTAAQSVIGFAYIDSRFDRVERFQTSQEVAQAALQQFSWHSYEETAAWNRFKALNSHLELTIPDIQHIKTTYTNTQ